MAVSAAIYGLEGLTLNDNERAFFRDVEPWGFILFARNCDSPAQIRRLTDDLRALTGRDDTPILIDQEGGRVQRLKPPYWRAAPPAAVFGALRTRDAAKAHEALHLNVALIGAELAALGVNVDCLPVLDVPQEGAHDIIGDRAFAREAERVAELGRIACAALMGQGVLPVIKHIPGHGRALADSHLDLPVVDASRSDLEVIDFAPFRALRDMPLAMTAHVVYTAIDKDRCATLSPIVIADIIRGAIGFDGLLMSDDLSMKALKGSFQERTAAALAAGCDVVLHCNGDMAEMMAIAGAAPTLAGVGAVRAEAALARLAPPRPFDVAEAKTRLQTLMTA